MQKRFAFFLLGGSLTWAATLGRVVPLTGGAVDLALDETRNQVYLTSGTQNLLQIYSLQRQTFLTPIPTDTTPLTLALSPDRKLLYVACYDASTIDVINLTTNTIASRIGLPAKPEAIAAGKDGRLLISTSGSGTTGANPLLVYDPAAGTVGAVNIVPPVAAVITSPPPSNRPFLGLKSLLVASRSGNYIAGVTVATNGTATAFVYEAASASILRSRTLANLSTNLAISDDGTRVYSGAVLFDAATFQVLAVHSPVNSIIPLSPASSFALPLANQGGSVFTPDGQTLYSGLNVAPVGAAATTSQLILSDPDNLMVKSSLQIPENLAGRMVLSADGANLYALSDSGFAILPLGTVSTSALAVPAVDAILLTRDQCGITSSTGSVLINNPGRGRITASAILQQFAGIANQASPATAPTARASTVAAGPQIAFTFNAALSRGYGTITPPHDFVVQSIEAINVPDRVRVYENVRDSDARGTIVPLASGGGQTLPLVPGPFPDMQYDAARQRLYIANTWMNRVEVYDIQTQKLLTPIKVGQSPVSLALTLDGSVLYVANAGGESISIVDPVKLQTTGQVLFPPVPVNSNQAVIFPTVIATSLNDPMVIMNTGALWRIVNGSVIPRGVSKLIGQTTQGTPLPVPVPSTLSATPAGEFVLLTTSTGIAYLYDANADDFIASRTGAAPTGYAGPVTAGPGGRFFVVNGTLLNSSLVPARAAAGLVAASTLAGTNSYAVLSAPAAAAANTLPTTPPTLQIVDAASGLTTVNVPMLEGPSVAATGAARAIVGGRTMAVDIAGGMAYALTTSGLSIVPLTPVAAADRPQPFNRGAVNLASYQTQVAPNGLLSIFGTNLGTNQFASSEPLPTVLGGTCVTLNNTPMSLMWVSPGQINAQIPPNLAPGTYPLVVRSLAKQAASASQNLTVAKYAPAVLVSSDGQILLTHQDGSFVNQDNPANRDEPLTMYAVGLGAVKGGPATGLPAPESPLLPSDSVQVFFGNPAYKQSDVIVDWSGLAPGFIGLYQLNLRVPGFHGTGDALPVTIRIGGIDSPTTGPVVPLVAVN
jgi:uncharacterized protein (TIGR03437 family)